MLGTASSTAGFGRWGFWGLALLCLWITWVPATTSLMQGIMFLIALMLVGMGFIAGRQKNKA